MMIDILYCAKGRHEFTLASLDALRRNTDWRQIERVYLYTDGDAPDSVAHARLEDVPVVLRDCRVDGPVGAMNHYLSSKEGAAYESAIVAKIDNDVIVPPNWLEPCIRTMECFPELDLLGIEPPSSSVRIRLANPGHPIEADFTYCDSIGGIGLIRRRAFFGRPPMRPHSTYGGFTDWQIAHPEVQKGWLVPSIRLFLLDRLTMDPWASLSKRYIAEGQQRPWKMYSPQDAHLWDWWLKGKQAAA